MRFARYAGMSVAGALNHELDESAQARQVNALRSIAIVASVLIVIIAATAKIPTYRINPIFLLPLLWAPYWLRRRLFLNALAYSMFAIAILLHDLGAYGWYQSGPLPFSWDILVHFFFPIPVMLIMHAAIGGNFPVLRRWHVVIASLLFMMGLGALHEIMEYGSYLLLGEEKGMLKPGRSYFFDTQRDLTSNLLGALTALAIIFIGYAFRRRDEASGGG